MSLYKGIDASKSRIDRLGFQRQHTEDAFVDAPQRLAGDEAVEGFHAERKFPESHGALCPKGPLAQPRQMLGCVVIRTIDDPQILSASALDGGLHHSASPLGDEV